jgi:hypothetical protein
MGRTQIALAGRIRAGDTVVIDGSAQVIERVKRAQGRKPAVGENLHLVTQAGEILRVNSATAVRIEPRRALDRAPD